MRAESRPVKPPLEAEERTRRLVLEEARVRALLELLPPAERRRAVARLSLLARAARALSARRENTR